ncbi:MAG: peptide ABC transporter substrate-binding protein [Woeseiaceae bacterium]
MKKLLLVLLLLAAVVGYFLLSNDDSGDAGAPVAPTLNRGVVSDPESIDPHKARSTQAAEVLRDIGEGLLSYSATGELVGGVAESWTLSEDGLTYTFKLRENARWSNGDPVTAEHFVFSLRRLVDPATAAFYAQAVAAIVNVNDVVAGKLSPEELGVSAPDNSTLVMTLQQPTPYMLSLLTHPSTFPVHPGSIEQHGDNFTRPENLLSNGAYKLVSREAASVLRLQRNEHYWNNAATSIDRVDYHVITQEMAELNRFRSGEIDITGTVAADSFTTVREQYADELHVTPYLGVYYYGFNLTKPPFKDNPQLRQALSMAIDRETLVEKVTGRGEVAAYSWVPPGVDNYEPIRFGYADMTQAERNATARRLYREAGYGDDNPAQIEIRYNTADIQRRIALAIQSMWAETLGVETTLVNEEFQVLLANMREAEVTQIFRSSWIGDYNDAHTFLNILQSGNPSNMPRFANELFDKRMHDASVQTDLHKRRLYLEEAERVLLREHPVIPIYFYVSSHLVNSRVQGWGDNILDYHYSQHLSLATETN